jgi:hypothetical protein
MNELASADASVWLDLTKDHRHVALLDTLFEMVEAKEVGSAHSR